MDAVVVIRVSAFAILFFIATCVGAVSPVKPQGTYSTLKYNREGGDLLGYEVRIVPTVNGLQAVVQVAEGVPGPLYIVPVLEKDGIIKFEIPITANVRGAFEGKATAVGLEGKLTLPAGTTNILLKRKTSYWEK